MPLSDVEVQSLRFHLGYGNIAVGAYPYTPDGFLELFESVVAPNLETGNDTTSATSVTADTVTTITVGAITGITARAQLIVDTGTDEEIVSVKSVSGLTVTARFAKAHSGTYPISTLSGESRLRRLLADADKVWATLQSADITGTAGLKQLGQGEIEWFPGGTVLTETQAHYRSIQQSISSLVRVEVAQTQTSGRDVALSAY